MTIMAAGEWTEAGKTLGQMFQAYLWAEYVADSFEDVKPNVLNMSSDTQLSNWKFLGLEKYVNTDTKARLYPSITGTAGAWTITVYSDSARTASIATASGTTAASTTATLVEQNDSGLTGTVDIAFTAAIATIILQIDFPYRKPIDYLQPDVANIQQSQYREDLKLFLKTAYQNMATSARSMKSNAAAAINEYVSKALANMIDSSEVDVSVVEEILNSDGSIDIDYDGIIKDFIDAMTADDKNFLENTAALGALTAGSGQNGSATSSGGSIKNWAYPGTIKIECTKTLTSSPEEFKVSQQIDGDVDKITARNLLTFAKQFRSSDIGYEVTLVRDVDFTDTSSTGTTLSTFVISGETSSNVDVDAGGLLYGVISTSGGNVVISFYNNVARTSSYLVAQGTADGTSGTVNCTSQRGSGLSVSCSLSYGDNGNVQIDLNTCDIDDYFTVAVTNDEAGYFATVLGRYFGQEFATDSSADISDDYLLNAIDALSSPHLCGKA